MSDEWWMKEETPLGEFRKDIFLRNSVRISSLIHNS